VTHMEALSINIGEKVILSYSDISNDECKVKIVNDDTIEVILKGFHYHVSLTDFTEFVVTQVKSVREIGC
jgi:competence transcription factor ComK